MCPCHVNNFMKYLFENKLINYSMVLVCLYLIEVGVHRYVGSTQNLIGRLGDHYRRSLSDDSTGPLSSVMRRSKYLDEICGRVLAVYDIPVIRQLGHDWNILEKIDPRISECLEHYWINDLESDLNICLKNKYSSKYLRECHDRYLVIHGCGRTVCLKDAHDTMLSVYDPQMFKPEIEYN